MGHLAAAGADVERSARRLAAGLRERGVGPGDVVVFQLPNWMEAVGRALPLTRDVDVLARRGGDRFGHSADP